MYERLYKLYYNELCSYVSSLTKSSASAEDIVQNVMLKIWKSKHNLNINGSLKNYLYRSCYNEFVDTYNKRKKELNYVDSVQKEVLEFFLEDESDFIIEKTKHVHIEIEKLPPKCKEIFVLAKINGFKYKEIAEQLDISIKTVETQMTKAMYRIKEGIHSI